MAHNSVLLLLLLVASCTLAAALHRDVPSVPGISNDEVDFEKLVDLETTGFLAFGEALDKVTSGNIDAFVATRYEHGDFPDVLKVHLRGVPRTYDGNHQLTMQEYYRALLVKIVISMEYLERKNLLLADRMRQLKLALRNVICMWDNTSTAWGALRARDITYGNIILLLDFYFVRVYGGELGEKGPQGFRDMILGLLGYIKFRLFLSRSANGLEAAYTTNAMPLNLLYFPIPAAFVGGTWVEDRWQTYFSRLKIGAIAAHFSEFFDGVPFRMAMYNTWRAKRGLAVISDADYPDDGDFGDMLYLLGFSRSHKPQSRFIDTLGPLVRSLADPRFFVPIVVIAVAGAAWMAYSYWTVPEVLLEMDSEPLLSPDAAVAEDAMILKSLPVLVPAHDDSAHVDGEAEPEDWEWTVVGMSMLLFVMVIATVGAAAWMLLRRQDEYRYTYMSK